MKTPPKDEEEAFNQFDYLSVFDADVLYRETRHIERLCVRYGVLLPARDDRDMYEPFYDSGIVVMTPNGKAQLTAEIRAAKKEHLDVVRSWVLAVSGLIGIIIGLISVL